ncbi:MAG: hypothetical protein Q4A61_02130 [Porphyromonadaceae bacterium]|nr:hypothetical protein [Porphyromonadaceae bacterium]
MRKLFSIALLGLLTASVVTSCSKDEPKKNVNSGTNNVNSGTNTEEPAKRDWLDGKTFEYIKDLDKPAEERMAHDIKLEFVNGKVKYTLKWQEGTEASGDYVVIRQASTGDYTYEKPTLAIKNLKGMSKREEYKNGKLVSSEEKPEEAAADEEHKLQVDEEKGSIIVPEDNVWDIKSIPLKK